jgi:hypothetical protein
VNIVYRMTVQGSAAASWPRIRAAVIVVVIIVLLATHSGLSAAALAALSR